MKLNCMIFLMQSGALMYTFDDPKIDADVNLLCHSEAFEVDLYFLILLGQQEEPASTFILAINN